MRKLSDFEILTFDCYGTLIDWEQGINASLVPILASHRLNLNRDELLQKYATLEAEAEDGPYQTYREILRRVLEGFGKQYDFKPTEQQLDVFAESVTSWPPFEDSPEALRRLQSVYKLAVLSNIDDDLFAASAARLGIEFDFVFTAQQIGSYKPSINNFHYTIERLGLAPERILHVAQSLYHDIVPAQKVGLTTVWINRRHDQTGSGATPEAEAIPDFEYPDMRSFAGSALGE
ncbi:MAG: haloacid dehalogenase type II [candidate division Zixibacteria bacterium]|nr:haloacid dehalogenase type II [candidate division Zixibacteria bacterium]MDH3937271.1 haloacid dehalogenase type II [candidate division Zixibacteria bacterium]